MRVIFFGTPLFASSILEFLLDQPKVEIVGVITQSDKPRSEMSEVKKIVLKRIPLVPLFQPEKATDPVFIEDIRKLKADLFIVVAYGKILRPALLNIPLKEAINIHASLLPKYRGAAPIQRALMNGEKTTGISIIKMVPEMDAGDILAQKKVAIEDDINFGALHDKLCEEAKPLLLEVIQAYEKNEVKKQPQEESQVTFASKIELKDLEIDFFHQTAKDIFNLIRAFSPRPGARCFIEINDQRKQMKILNAEIVDLKGEAGKILKREKHDFIIACKDKSLKIKSLQIEGKKTMTAVEFINGVKGTLKIF